MLDEERIKSIKNAMKFGFDPSTIGITPDQLIIRRKPIKPKVIKVKTVRKKKLKKTPVYPVVPRPQSLYKLMRSNQQRI